jgi:thiol-disulfide isomerase/thioredoxin
MKILLAGILFSVSCFAQLTTPPIDQKGPEVELSQLLQAPAGTQPVLSALRGKAVVIEFWATWCGPCVTEIPHLNELVEQVKGKPVVFLSVTDEE